MTAFWFPSSSLRSDLKGPLFTTFTNRDQGQYVDSYPSAKRNLYAIGKNMYSIHSNCCKESMILNQIFVISTLGFGTLSSGGPTPTSVMRNICHINIYLILYTRGTYHIY